MKKLRKLRLNDVQQLKTSELEMINAGREFISVESCDCKYIGDTHTRVALSANVSLSKLLDVYGQTIATLDTFARYGGKYGECIGAIIGIYNASRLIDPRIDVFEMELIKRDYTGEEHISRLIRSIK